MSIQIEELLAQYSPEERRRYEKDWVAGIKAALPTFDKETQEEIAKEVVAEIKPEVLFSGLTEEQRRELRRLLNQETEKKEN